MMATEPIHSREVDADAPTPLEQVHDESRFGGKAAQLGAALRAGLPVPGGVALEVALVDAVAAGDPAAIARCRAALSLVGSHAVAVRSSAVGEDSAQASFAGQHLTRLNVTGADALVEAVTEVWQSGRSEAALSYRARLGLPGAPRVGVVVQEMVDPECAGVLFTRNPLDGSDERVIEAAWGLGEAVVGGMVEPDRYRLARGGEVKEATIGDKDIAVRMLASGDTAEVPVEEHLRTVACLDATRLAQLETLAARCEALFEGAHDIEWAFANGRLYAAEALDHPMTRLMEARALAAALDAADSHALLHALAERGATVEQLAQTNGIDPVGCSRILEVLRSQGLLERDGDVYRASAPVVRELQGPASDSRESGWPWSHARKFLATGEPHRRMHDKTQRGALYGQATPLLGRMFDVGARALASHLARRFADRPCPNVLDVGAGSGVWSLALLAELPQARVVGLDLPGVVSRFQERADSLGVGERARTVAGDYHEEKLDQAFDVVILANVLHLEPAAQADRLLARWADAVADSGVLVVVDMLSASGADPAHAAYALHLALRVPGGYPHLEPDLRRWMTAAGFGKIERVALDPLMEAQGALIASRE